MAEVVRYVDPDASGSGDGTSWTDAYTSLNSCLSDESGDYTAAGNWLHVYCRSSGGTADTTAVEQYDAWWTTDSTNKIVVEAESGDGAVTTGIDSSRYRLSIAAGSNPAIYIDAQYCDLIGLQIEKTGSGGTVHGIQYTNAASGLISRCYISVENTEGLYGIAFDGSGDIEVESTIVKVASDYTTDAWYRAIEAHDSNSGSFYNCTVYGDGNGQGLKIDNVSATITNCAIFNFGDDTVHYNAGSDTIDYCATDDGDGTNAVAASGSDWTNEFSDPANGDFTLLNTGNLYQGGTAITGGPSTDIDGDSWLSPPSIGADEYGTASSAAVVKTGAVIFNSPVFGGVLVS